MFLIHFHGIFTDNGRGYINKSMMVDKSANLTLIGSSQVKTICNLT